MGVILRGEACPLCAYQPPKDLFYSGGKLGFFRGLATCHTHHDLVSVSPDFAHIPVSFIEMYGGPEAYAAHVAATTARMNIMHAFDTCPQCGGHDLTHHDISEAYDTKKPLSAPCPRCETGHVQLHKIGYWD